MRICDQRTQQQQKPITIKTTATTLFLKVKDERYKPEEPLCILLVLHASLTVWQIQSQLKQQQQQQQQQPPCSWKWKMKNTNQKNLCAYFLYFVLTTLLLLPPPPPPFFFFGGGGGSSCLFCHFDIDVCIYSTCTFLIVKQILMLIMYSATRL